MDHVVPSSGLLDDYLCLERGRFAAVLLWGGLEPNRNGGHIRLLGFHPVGLRAVGSEAQVSFPRLRGNVPVLSDYVGPDSFLRLVPSADWFGT